MARIVIADAGPLIAFSGIDGLSILQKLFSEITIVGSVKDEYLAKPSVDAQRIEDAINNGWLVVAPVVERSPPLSPSLGVGESDSIRFALEAPEESLLIMDDRLARRYALRKNLNIVGTVRLLDFAEQRGLIESAERYIQEMSGFGYRLSNDILKQIRSE
ncbi:MAG: hypothetical protein JMN27_17185 [gamma proteobacterium endosymbiont of Lamellibrachia anaximandri]|nr:hypothetical protein [gamma proteobacterium endosymbiont of Lamellibrachia anaximandri]MBL3535541.1 hypothetical protein [gamma proteobacterium endosymbiont of Lamellibrachia anaximandri]